MITIIFFSSYVKLEILPEKAALYFFMQKKEQYFFLNVGSSSLMMWIWKNILHFQSKFNKLKKKKIEQSYIPVGRVKVRKR